MGFVIYKVVYFFKSLNVHSAIQKFYQQIVFFESFYTFVIAGDFSFVSIVETMVT